MPIETNLRRIFVNQRNGDPDRQNANCGYVSALMALRALGLRDPVPAPILGGEDYRKAMALRQLGGGGVSDRVWGRCRGVRDGLRALGASADFLGVRYGERVEVAVETMKDEFLDGSRDEVFVICGNPTRAWPGLSPARTGHFVMVAGYDSTQDVFTVLDPEASGPIQVGRSQIARFLEANNATDADEVIRVRRGSSPGRVRAAVKSAKPALDSQEPAPRQG